MSGIVGILLAAGQGRRFGADKLLHPLPDGTPLALAAARALKAACPRAVAVLRPDQTSLSALLTDAGLAIVICPEAGAGMGHSLAAGVAATQDADAWLVALADMPFVRSTTHARIVAALADGASLAAPTFNGQRGHPVGFTAEWRDALLALSGDVGARAILSRHANRLSLIDGDDPGVLCDVDTPADLAPASAAC